MFSWYWISGKKVSSFRRNNKRISTSLTICNAQVIVREDVTLYVLKEENPQSFCDFLNYKFLFFIHIVK
jgi:hypothetical protein